MRDNRKGDCHGYASFDAAYAACQPVQAYWAKLVCHQFIFDAAGRIGHRGLMAKVLPEVRSPFSTHGL